MTGPLRHEDRPGVVRGRGRPLSNEQEGVDHELGVSGDADEAGGEDRHRRDRGFEGRPGNHSLGNPGCPYREKPESLAQALKKMGTVTFTVPHSLKKSVCP